MVTILCPELIIYMKWTKHKLPKLTQEGIENLWKLITNKKIKRFKKEVLRTSLIAPRKQEQREQLLTHSMCAALP